MGMLQRKDFLRTSAMAMHCRAQEFEMLDERHVDVAGQEGELDRAQFGEGPALAAAAGGDGLAPDRRYLFAQRLVS